MKREETPFLSTAMNFIDSEGMCNFIIYNTENQAICVFSHNIFDSKLDSER